jgi:transcriptional regulator with XRE-family HTH domain
MARRPVVRMNSPPTAGKTGIEKLDLQQFARKLHQLMVERGLSQSDLARRIWGERIDNKTGYPVAKNRDRISVYLRGNSYPDPENLEKLAEALGVTVESLAPDIVASVIDRENPELAITAIAGRPDAVHLQVNKLVPMSVASRIMALLTETDQDR